MTYIPSPASGIPDAGNTSTANVGGADSLNGAIGVGDVTITLFSAAQFPTSGTVKIDSEYITFTGNTGTQLTGCGRGAFQSTPAIHNDLKAVTGVYVGVAILNNQPGVMVSCKSDQDGTLFFDFSTDNAVDNYDTFPSNGFNVTSFHEFHTAVKGPRYFRVRFENGSGVLTTSFRVYTYFGVFRQGNLPLNQNISDDADSTVVRSVLTGALDNGDYVNVGVDPGSNGIKAAISNPLTSFGELRVSNLSPVAQLKFIYGVNEADVEEFLNAATIVTMGTEGSAGVAQVQSIYLPEANSFTAAGAGDYFTLEDGGGNPFYVWFDVDAGNIDPAPGGTGLQVSITSGDTPSQVGTAAQTVITADAAFSATVFGNIVTITNATSTDSNPTSINAENMPSTSSSTISVTKGSSIVSLTNGAGVGDYAVLRGVRGIRYRPGSGLVARFTTIFDTAVANTYQFSGVGNSTSSLYIGYDGTQLQLWRRTQGLHEIQELEITSVAGAIIGTVVITVDGIDFTIDLTSVVDTGTVARQIAAQDFTTALYTTDVVDSKVIFLSDRVDNNTGNNNFTFALGTATNVTASFTEITQAQAQTSTAYTQSAWNIDTLDGTGPSGMTIDPQSGNVYQVAYEWLGFGAIVWSVENPLSGAFVPFHRIEIANTGTDVSLSQPDMQLTAFVSSVISTTPITLQVASMSAFVEGQIKRFAPNYSVSNAHAGVNGVTTNVILFAIRNPRTFNGLTNQVQVNLKDFTAAVSGSANNTRALGKFSIVLGGTPSASIGFNYRDEGKTPTYIATPAAGTTLTGFTILFTSSVPTESAVTYSLIQNDLILFKNQTLYVIYTNTAPSTGTIRLDAALSWVEDQ